jgi:hypothetical protein
VKRTIEIDDSAVPDGWEPVAFREPLIDDDFVMSSGGAVEPRGSCAPDGPRLIVRPVSENVTMVDSGKSVLVANDQQGPYVERVLVHVAYGEKDYRYVCEAIDHRLPHQCWRFAKRMERN